MTPVPAEAAKNTRNVMVNRGPFEVPGFLAGAAESGMRYADRFDLALIYAENPAGCAASGVFTTNSFCAAPVELCRERLEKRRAAAILANAGIANACTGRDGKIRAGEMARMASEALGCPAGSVLVSSTGVIGLQVDLDPVARSMPGLVKALRPGGWRDAARAIMTTDTVEKMASARFDLGGRSVTVGGIAKGSGMIAPDMATLLVFACTDAAVSPEVLDHWTRAGADSSFNCITVDGDTSTNDSLIVLAGGAAGNPPIMDLDGGESRAFGEALASVLRDLSIQIVMDAEGATKLIEIEVRGAADRRKRKAGRVYRCQFAACQNRLFRSGRKLGKDSRGCRKVRRAPGPRTGGSFLRRPLRIRGRHPGFGRRDRGRSVQDIQAERNSRPPGPRAGKCLIHRLHMRLFLRLRQDKRFLQKLEAEGKSEGDVGKRPSLSTGGQFGLTRQPGGSDVPHLRPTSH